jgi:hypothetical protein
MARVNSTLLGPERVAEESKQNPMSNNPHPLPAPVFGEPSFAEPEPTPDPARFVVDHPSDTPLYNELKRFHLNRARGFEKSRIGDEEVVTFESAYGPRGPEAMQQIRKAGKIVLHAVGDTGSTKGVESQNLVTDMLVADCNAPDRADRPAFFYHLGDVVYSFAEANYYYDQFTSRIEIIPDQSSPLPATMTECCRL